MRGYRDLSDRNRAHLRSIPTNAGIPLRHFVTQENEKSPPTAIGAAALAAAGSKLSPESTLTNIAKLLPGASTPSCDGAVTFSELRVLPEAMGDQSSWLFLCCHAASCSRNALVMRL